MKKNEFDYVFYTKMYPDIRHLNARQAYFHYIQYGKKERRICNQLKLLDFQHKIDKRIQREYLSFDIETYASIPEKCISILIRTSNRPEYFKKCIDSILKQEYTHYKVFICYDKVESLDYLEMYKDNPKIHYFYIQIESDKKYKFNLYCNQLLDCVKDGYVLFLDDDDILCHSSVLRVLNAHCKMDSILIWNFYRADKLIFPVNVDNIVLGEIDTSSFMAHINTYINCKWGSEQCGDFTFFNQVICTNNPTIKYVDYILCRTQFGNKIGNSYF